MFSKVPVSFPKSLKNNVWIAEVLEGPQDPVFPKKLRTQRVSVESPEFLEKIYGVPINSRGFPEFSGFSSKIYGSPDFSRVSREFSEKINGFLKILMSSPSSLRVSRGVRISLKNLCILGFLEGFS